MIQFGLSFLAGLLTTLSPCVLPMLPMILGGAIQKNKLAPFYMVLGLMFGFTSVGFILSRFRHVFGADSVELRQISALLLIVLAMIMLSHKLQDILSEKLSFLSAKGSHFSHSINNDSALGSILIGLFLGLIWSPCSGPTLGIAVGLAAQEGYALRSLTLMFVFSMGAAIPLLAIAYGLREIYFKNKEKILNTSKKSKIIFGYLMLVTAILIITGLDKKIEIQILSLMPEAWVNLTTLF